MERRSCDYAVVGSGIAGLYAALRLAAQGNVILITKSTLTANNSSRAQGGIAVALEDGDSPEAHMHDTLACGAYLNHEQAVRTMVENSPAVLQELLELGVPFDLDERGKPLLGKEGFHQAPRIVHAAGDGTGKAIVDTLVQCVLQNERITVVEHAFVEDLIVADGQCHGALLYEGTRKQHVALFARAVILACGGCGQVYDRTTNGLESTGDGYALAYRAGAVLTDMEFVQFHPTAMHVAENPRPLVSEAVRGEGATLINSLGEAFMAHYHSWADLAPRDVVARAIYTELMADRAVYLDTTAIGERFGSRFPGIYARSRARGIDPVREPMPISPAMHFMMGGVQTDTWGQTTIHRLYACGEVACTGVHGANRLASNSLLEGLVFAARIADHVQRHVSTNVPTTGQTCRMSAERYADVAKSIRPRFDARVYAVATEEIVAHPELRELQENMWQHVGIVREEQGLQTMRTYLRRWKQRWAAEHPVFENVAHTAGCIAESAQVRMESRGAHYRADYPQTERSWEKEHIVWRKSDELVGSR